MRRGRPRGRASVWRVRGVGPRGGGAQARGRDPAGDPRWPADPRERAGAAPSGRGAASPAGLVRGERGRRDLPGRGVLPETEERVPLRPLRRVAAVVPAERAEAARALMIELFPEGFEERDLADGVELVAYTDAGGEERLWAAFGTVSSDRVENGWG